MKVAIIGCGYVGTAAALYLRQKEHLVTATTSRSQKGKGLNKLAQKIFIAKGTDKSTIETLIKDNDILILTISTSSPENYKSTYLRTAQTFRQTALEVGVPKTLIYTSNSIVYGDHQGHWVDETSALKPQTEQAKILVETEKTLLSLQKEGWKVCILRLAEIYGPEREISRIVKKLEQHTLPGSGDHFTNMIHQEDVINAIDYIITYHLEGIYNLADDDHPSRKDLYDEICSRLYLPKIQWEPTHAKIDNGNRRVSNHKIKATGFEFSYPHRLLS